MSLLQFAPKTTPIPSSEGWSIKGPAHCRSCGHDWAAEVAGIAGSTWAGVLECQICHEMAGKFIDPPFPSTETAWCCNACSSFHFYFTPNGTFCAHCNSEQHGF